MSFELLGKHIKLVNAVLIAIAIINFVLLITSEGRPYFYGIIINWILSVSFMVNGVATFRKKRTMSIIGMAGSLVIAPLTIWQMILFY